MKISSNIQFDTLNKILARRGLEEKGKVQKFVDSEVLRLSEPYTPALNLNLTRSGVTATKIGSGVVEYNAVHARYQYYGKLMVSSVTGSAFANKGEKKVLTNIKLKYNTSKHSRAGSFWFERMKADRLNDILSGAIKIAGGK